MSHVNVVIGAGSIGQAIARRASSGKRVLLADVKLHKADAAANVLRDAGFEVSTAVVDVVRIPLIADTHSKLIADSVPGDRGHPGWGA
jgi:saccharopine dehydrogenase-like NADP-dependent oxidoreductase